MSAEYPTSFKELYDQVSWLVKQEKTSTKYSLAESSDVVDLYNRLGSALVASQPERFREIYETTLTSDQLSVYTNPSICTVFAVKVAEYDWTKPFSYNSKEGYIKLYKENTIKFESGLSVAVGTALSLDCAFYRDKIALTELDPTGALIDIEYPPDAINTLIYQIAEQVFIRNDSTPTETFYRAMTEAYSVFKNKRPTFTQQTVTYNTVKFGR